MNRERFPHNLIYIRACRYTMNEDKTLIQNESRLASYYLIDLPVIKIKGLTNQRNEIYKKQ